MSKLFQIYEDDLADLERALPEVCDRLKDRLDNRTRTHIRRIQTILSNVRWNYGPPSEIHKIEPNEENNAT